MDFMTHHGLFISQVCFSFIGVGFSIAMLSSGKDPSIYLPILTTIIGVWTPNPLSNRQTNTNEIANTTNVPRSRLVPLESVRVEN